MLRTIFFESLDFPLGSIPSPLKYQLHWSFIYIQYIVSISMCDLTNSDRGTRRATATVKILTISITARRFLLFLCSPFLPSSPVLGHHWSPFLSLWVSWHFLELPPTSRKVHMAPWMVKKLGCIEGSLLYAAVGSPGSTEDNPPSENSE